MAVVGVGVYGDTLEEASRVLAESDEALGVVVLGELQNLVSERLKAGLALEQEREQDGTNLYTEMYENVLDYKSMSEAYESLKSAETGSRSKYTKEGYVSIIGEFLDRQGLIVFVREDEMIKTTAKLDNVMEYKILNKENYARIMEALGETYE